MRRSLMTWMCPVVLLLALTAPAAGQEAATSSTPPPPPPEPPSNLEVKDHPWDLGTTIDLSWDLSPTDRRLTAEEVAEGVAKPVMYYEVLRSTEENGHYRSLVKLEPSKKQYRKGRVHFEAEKCVLGQPYYFRVMAVGQQAVKSSDLRAGPVESHGQFFDGGRFWLMIIVVILCGSVIYWINHARKGKPLKVRKIAGLEAVDEAVGRATEMGRSCLFIPGIQDMNDIQTIAGITVLARVSRTAAEYDAKVEVPTSRALVMTAARETVQSAFLSAGRPEAYNDDLIYYVTDEQFGYVAYLQGMMVREKPAACFYMGSFFAESLILAETGNSIGAIQVAGTAQPAQLPFFVAACDYTLIGEEFFAASAYLSGSPEELGSLKGQDVGKVIVALGLVVGAVLATMASLTGSLAIQDTVDFITQKLLT